MIAICATYERQFLWAPFTRYEYKYGTERTTRSILANGYILFLVQFLK